MCFFKKSESRWQVNRVYSRVYVIVMKSRKSAKRSKAKLLTMGSLGSAVFGVIWAIIANTQVAPQINNLQAAVLKTSRCCKHCQFAEDANRAVSNKTAILNSAFTTGYRRRKCEITTQTSWVCNYDRTIGSQIITIELWWKIKLMSIRKPIRSKLACSYV